MASPERLVRAEEDITAISDTVLDIKATVDAHTETLSEHGRDLVDIKGTLSEHGRDLVDIKGTLSEHGRDLADMKGTLATITSTLGEILTAIRPAK
jgi:chromosome segregation ATPase